MVMDANTFAGKIVDAASAVHRKTGPGLLEPVYEAALGHEPNERELAFSRQHRIDGSCRGHNHHGRLLGGLPAGR
jgi:GxxExxY protein